MVNTPVNISPTNFDIAGVTPAHSAAVCGSRSPAITAAYFEIEVNMDLQKNENLRIPVAAPAPGYQFQIVSEKTAWQLHSDTFKALGKPVKVFPLPASPSRHWSTKRAR